MNDGDRFAGRFLIPGGLWLLAFFAVPFAIVVALSFGTPGELGGAVYGWYPENYSRAFDPVFVPVLLRSVGYALATVALCLLLGYPVAYYIARFGGRHKHVLIALVVLPFFVNYLVRTYAWVALLSDEGVVNGVLGLDDPIRFLNTPVRGDRRARLRLPRVHDPAGLRGARPHGPGADRGRQGPLRLGLEHVLARDVADDVPGRAGRHRARVPARGRRLRERAAAGRPGHLHDRQPHPAAVLRARRTGRSAPR